MTTFFMSKLSVVACIQRMNMMHVHVLILFYATFDNKCLLKITRAYLRGGVQGVQTPPPPKFSDFFLKSEGKEIEKKGMLGGVGYLLTYYCG